MTDAHGAFPASFAGLGLLSLYLAGKFHLWDRPGSAGVKAWICIIPLTGAAAVAISRTMDYRHHPTDVLSGAILGSFFAFASYHLYFPRLGTGQSDRYRVPDDRGVFWTRVDQEEVSVEAHEPKEALPAGVV